MKEKICTFCGHREVYDNVEEKVNNVVLHLIEKCGVNTFYSGHMGEFDNICELAVRKAKVSHPEIKLIRVAPYFTTDIDKFAKLFNETIMIESSNIHYKRAIPERNRYMVKKTDVLLCYLRRRFGGAYTTMEFAEMMGLEIIFV